jgi:hypothetical protein
MPFFDNLSKSSGSLSCLVIAEVNYTSLTCEKSSGTMIAKNGQLSDLLKHVHFVNRITFLKVSNNISTYFGIIYLRGVND